MCCNTRSNQERNPVAELEQSNENIPLVDKQGNIQVVGLGCEGKQNRSYKG